ncbi:iron ascorbate-dependent oxidoreductase [Castilleja foliolosa]|uniref:gibberellin 3beta-dioxygenase n=1 Tax=Castilleja foliolosa TaxID=1961234 RepID=A0ABD3CT43_9LAMI
MPSRKFSVNNIEQKYLDLQSLNELPETHAWTSQSDDHPFSDAGENLDNHEGVPIIDLNDQNALELIGHACKAWGVFQVLNHDIPNCLIDEMESAANRLFSLPVQQKLRAARQPTSMSGYGLARISSFFNKLMWSEGFTIAGSPIEHARLLWPDDYQMFCDTIEDYQKAMKALSARLIWLMLGSLGITNADMTWAENGCSALQLNSYPVCPDPTRAMGLAAHTDSTIVTILHQSNTRGLQVRREGSSRWIMVPPHPGALVVHVGDLLHMLSNGLYPSVLHRAVVNGTRHRLSVAYLYGPPESVKIGPLAKLVDEAHPRVYRSITWKDYLGKKAEHFNKALASVRVKLG